MPIEEKVYMMHKLDFIFGTQKMLINVYFLYTVLLQVFFLMMLLFYTFVT